MHMSSETSPTHTATAALLRCLPSCKLHTPRQARTCPTLRTCAPAAGEIERLGFYFMAVEVVGVVPKPAPRESLLESSNKALQSRLGNFYPLLLILQTAVIVLGVLIMLSTKLRRRWRLLRLQLASRRKNGNGGYEMPA